MNDRSIFRKSTGQLAQVAERRVAGAEVVDGEAHAERLQRLELLARRVDVVEQHALGELERESRGVEARRLRARARRSATRSRAASWRPDTLTLTAQALGADARAVPLDELAARLLEHELADRDDQPGLLGEVDELDRVDHAPLAVAPAHERLEARGLERRELDDRLVADLHLAAFERVTEIGEQRGALDDSAVHRRTRTACSAPCRRSSRCTSRCRRCA